MSMKVRTPMVEPRYPSDQIRLDWLIGATSTPIEEARLDQRSIEQIITLTRRASETEARLAEVIEALDAPPRFYFHFRWNAGFTPDHCGVALPDLAAARDWARTEAQHLAELEWPLGLDPLTGCIIIVDENGATLAEV